ncbi:glycoside hydrolase family 5 protein [Didymella exigua CBS 183.55]|uniref:Glycoside hydrolase family 5 protein n=1 Tax=Didymella exigua CBS 183.55 TaxID=1150837 RepID=A0A6A5RBB0_9PLEO|nr:glycoside hydrolase family 5 protein [Didymella exigua CBS 183.55]KAF1924570.1 glycoside hydrolase family 5 protein [Didymella exigua CBS 183.55]
MNGFLQKAKAEWKDFSQKDSRPGQDQHHGHQPHGPPGHGPPTGHHDHGCIKDPTDLDILRYRYHHGTNLGSVYVIEKWLQSSRFPENAEGSSELAAVKAWVDREGIECARQKFEQHWSSIVTDAAIGWLVNEAKCTTIRLPIGYYDLPGPDFTRGTPFEQYAQVYCGAWDSIRTLIQRLRKRSIGVLLDLHALPGGANAQEHSGTNSGRAEFWHSDFNRALGIRCAQFIAHEARNGLDIAGIQLVNEADWESHRMYEWYDEAAGAVSAIDPSIPIIISDGWNLEKAVEYSLRTNSVYTDRAKTPVVVDTHFYWAFTDLDKQKSPQQIIQEVGTKLGELDGKEGSVIDRGAVQTIVGEYSCVLTEDSWARSDGVPKEELVKQFGEAQSRRYQQRAGGSYFWTWKMDWMPGGEWGFKAQTDAKNIVPPQHATLHPDEKVARLDRARSEQDGRKQQAFQEHVNYWNQADPNGTYEHEKYEYGWHIGYSDALAFFAGCGSHGDRIGMLELWVLKRIRESGYRGGFTWLFEQGIRKGVIDFYNAAGI